MGLIQENLLGVFYLESRLLHCDHERSMKKKYDGNIEDLLDIFNNTNIYFLNRILLLIARMSIELLENILIIMRSRFTAAMRPDQRARTSAFKGELTKSWEIAPLLVCWFGNPEIIQPNPVLLVSLSQVASDLHVKVLDRLCWDLAVPFRWGFLARLDCVPCGIPALS